MDRWSRGFAEALFADLQRGVREYARLREQAEATAREAVNSRREVERALARLEVEVPIDHTPKRTKRHRR